MILDYGKMEKDLGRTKQRKGDSGNLYFKMLDNYQVHPVLRPLSMPLSPPVESITTQLTLQYTLVAII